MSTPQTAPTISLQYQAPLLSPLKTRYIVLYGHPHRYVSVPGTLQGFLEIGVASMGGEFYYYYTTAVLYARISVT
jgi:hypothetical protein